MQEYVLANTQHQNQSYQEAISLWQTRMQKPLHAWQQHSWSYCFAADFWAILLKGEKPFFSSPDATQQFANHCYKPQMMLYSNSHFSERCRTCSCAEQKLGVFLWIEVDFLPWSYAVQL